METAAPFNFWASEFLRIAQIEHSPSGAWCVSRSSPGFREAFARDVVDGIELGELFAEVEGVVSPLIAPERLQLEITPPEQPIEVHSDRLRWRQILLNLLSNAIKFTDEGYIAARARIDGEDVILEIEDTGVGIAQENFAELFKPFSRLEIGTSTIQGSGLGLSLSRYLANLMGGDISLSSEVGEGTTFVVRLPLVLDLEGQERGSELITSDYNPRDVSDARQLVLVIDDDPNVYDLFKRYSVGLDMQLLWATSAEQGVELARACQPDLITLDVFLGSESGWTALERLREEEATREIPVVTISFVERCERPTEGFVRKPVSRNQWRQVIGEFIG